MTCPPSRSPRCDGRAPPRGARRQDGPRRGRGDAAAPRLEAMIAAELAEAKARFAATSAPVRVFKELAYSTRDSWTTSRRVVAKAEHLEKGANPRFIVTSLAADTIAAAALYETIYCQRGEMAKATAGTIRLKLLKIGAVVTVSVRRIKIAFATACPAKTILALALSRLRSIERKAHL